MRRFRRITAGVVSVAALVAGVAGVARAATDPVVPYLNCVHYNPDSFTLTSIWGYGSTASDFLIEDVGPDNFFQPDPQDQGQATLFFPGLNNDAFEVTHVVSVASSITWTLNGMAVTGGMDSPMCDSPNTAPFNPHTDGVRGFPAVVGTPVVGEPVFAEVGTWEGNVVSHGYQWQIDNGGWHDIGGAHSSTYVPVPGDAGHALRIHVSATSGGGAVGGMTSPASAPVAPVAAPSLTHSPPLGLPAVVGSPVVGSPLFAEVGDWQGQVEDFGYQWQALQSSVWTDVSGAQASTFTPTPDLVGDPLRVLVTAEGSASDSAAVASAQTAPVAAGLAAGVASITGSPLVGSTLTAHPGTWVGASAFDYDWQRCAITCAPTGGTASTYEPVIGDVGFALRVVVTPDGEASPQAVSPETDTIEPETSLSAFPASLAFGPRHVKKLITKNITLTNNGPTVSLGGFRRSGPNQDEFGVVTTCVTVPLQPGRKCVLHVKFVPRSAGARTATIEVFDAAGGVLTIPVTGTGV